MYHVRPHEGELLKTGPNPFNKRIDRNPEDSVIAAGPIPCWIENLDFFFQLLWGGDSLILITRDSPKKIEDRTGVPI